MKGNTEWNKIKHRLFSFISMNWRGHPLVSHEVHLNLIANTRTKSGLTVKAELVEVGHRRGGSR